MDAMITPKMDNKPPSHSLRWSTIAGTLLAIACLAEADPRPPAKPSPQADTLAREMMDTIHHQGWEQTGAVRWTFRGKQHHLWDRHRQLAQVRWDNIEVLINLTTLEGRVFRSGRQVQGEKAEKLVNKAWKAWVNDSFWLNPISKLFDEGTLRSLVDVDGGRGLLVEYTSGGDTPGDAYLWILGEDGLPSSWKMWTSNLPAGGMRASWDGWTRLATGVLVATVHKLAIGRVTLSNVSAAAHLSGLVPGPDPFASLVDALSPLGNSAVRGAARAAP